MTGLVLTFGVALLLSVATSDLASRTPLSSTAVFLAVGLVAGPLGLRVLDVDGKVVEGTAVVALYTILFTDGQVAPLPALRRHWRSSAATLLVGMPLTLVIIAALAHWVTGLPWAPSFVLGAVLAPTDPVFASALVGRHDVPKSVRNVLNIESGVNDGLALPAVLVLVGIAGGDPHGRSTDLPTLLLQLGVGLALGIAVPLAAWLLYRAPRLGTVTSLRPLGHVAIAVILFGLCQLTGGNPFLAAFVAGSTIATVQSDATEAFQHTGERLSELLQGAALLAFASLLGRDLFSTAGLAGFVFAVLVIAISRPVPVFAVLAPSRMSVRQRLSISWFGPKGFASVAYAAIVAFSHMADAEKVVALTAVTVLLSALAHSSTDLVVARKLAEEEPADRPSSRARRDAA
ncbi:sodium/hydrogen antiporter [Marmoricola sp. URHA0025 HA25]